MKKFLSVVLCILMMLPAIPAVLTSAASKVYVENELYYEDFEADFKDEGWSSTGQAGKKWFQIFSGAYAEDGEGFMICNSQKSDNAILKSPEISIPAYNTSRVSFWAKKKGGGYFRFYYRSQLYAYDMDIADANYLAINADNTWVYFEFDIPDYAKGGANPVFCFENTDDGVDLFIDSFLITYDEEYTAVKTVSATGFEQPVAGAVPQTDVTAGQSLQYNVTNVQWYNADGTELAAGERFKGGKSYYSRITVKACEDNGYMFEWTGGGQGIYHLDSVKINGSTSLVDKNLSFVSASGSYLYIYTNKMTPAAGAVSSFYIITYPSAYAAYDIRQNPPTGNLSNTTEARILYRNWIDEEGHVAEGYFKYGKTYIPHFVVAPNDGYYFEDDTPYATSQGTFTGSPDEYGYIHVFGQPVTVRLGENGVYGKCGTNCLYVYDKGTKVYMLMGTGVYDYNVGEGLYWDEMEVCAVCDGITELPNGFVIGAENLKTVWLEDSVKKLGDECFEDCYNIEDIVFSDSLEEIGDFCFNGVEQVTELVFPQSLKSIGNGCFYNMTNLSVLELNEGLKTVGRASFCGNPGIEEVYIPSSITSIDDSRFTETFGYYEDETKIPGFTVKGYDGTEAESFANRHGFTFVSLGEAEPLDLCCGNAVFHFMQMDRRFDGKYSVTVYAAEEDGTVGRRTVLYVIGEEGALLASVAVYPFREGDIYLVYDPETMTLTANGDGLLNGSAGFYSEEYYLTGSGYNGFLNDVAYEYDESNVMTEVSDGVYEITYKGVEPSDGKGYFFYICAGSYGLVGVGDEFGYYAEYGVEYDALFDISYNEIMFDVSHKSDVTVVLDVSGINKKTGYGAKYMIKVREVGGEDTEDKTYYAGVDIYDAEQMDERDDGKYELTVGKAPKTENVVFNIYDEDGKIYASVVFSTEKTGSFTIVYDPLTKQAYVDGSNVTDPEFTDDFYFDGTDKMKKTANNMYAYSFNVEVPKGASGVGTSSYITCGTNSDGKFVAVDNEDVPFNTYFDGRYSYGGWINYFIEETSDVTFVLDLRGFDKYTGEGAKIMVKVKAYDVNGDGAANNKDIIALFKYLSGDTTVTVDVSKLDINNDGLVNNKDIISLFNTLSAA